MDLIRHNESRQTRKHTGLIIGRGAGTAEHGQPSVRFIGLAGIRLAFIGSRALVPWIVGSEIGESERQN